MAVGVKLVTGADRHKLLEATVQSWLVAGAHRRRLRWADMMAAAPLEPGAAAQQMEIGSGEMKGVEEGKEQVVAEGPARKTRKRGRATLVRNYHQEPSRALLVRDEPEETVPEHAPERQRRIEDARELSWSARGASGPDTVKTQCLRPNLLSRCRAR